MSLRPLFGLCALAATFALAAPAVAAAGPGDQIYDAVNGYQANLRNDQETSHRLFTVTGVLRGQSAEQSVTYQYFDTTTADRVAPTCERLALIAMKDAGHFAFVVVTDPVAPTIVTACRLERR